MNKTAISITCAAIAAASAAAVLTDSQAAYFANRRICVRRDTATLPGYVITELHRNGKPDTKGPAVVTNRLQKIIGAEQKNPIQELAERMKQQAEQWQAAAEQWRETATNATARVERVTAALDERRAEYVQKRDAATMPTTKAIYQAFIDAIDRIKASMNGAANNTTWYEKATDGVNYIIHFPDGTDAMTCVHVGKPLSASVIPEVIPEVIPDYAVLPVINAGGSL